jgi:acyl carrier protein
MQDRCEPKKSIRDYILENFLFDSDDGTLSDDVSFLDQGIIDSTGIIELINWLEITFSISIGDKEMLPENLDSINKILVFINKKTERVVAGANF